MFDPHKEFSAQLEVLRLRSLSSPWISIQELARQMGVTVRTVRRLHAAGNAPPRVRRSRRLMYHRDDVERWLARERKPEK